MMPEREVRERKEKKRGAILSKTLVRESRASLRVGR